MSDRLTHPDLPDEIFAAYTVADKLHVMGKKEILENISGGTFIKRIASRYLDINDLRILTKKYEKPQAFQGNQEVSISFSHTDSAISAALSLKFVVGCDMESASRNVHSSLQKRMMQKEEADALYKKNEPIRIWTLKEAALKMIGTGLRKPMNCVRIEQLSEALFFVIFDDGKRAKICSFKHKDHWISICYKLQP